jgi:hypothetical protein
MSTQIIKTISVKKTQRHNFDTEVVRKRMESASSEERLRMLDEALHVIDGLRRTVRQQVILAQSISDISDTQWMGGNKHG